MLTVELWGGVGNQMFQYALIRSLSHDLKEDFSLNKFQYDLVGRFFKQQKHEHYNLNHFDIQENFSSSITPLTISFFLNIIFRNLNLKSRKKINPKYNVIQEDHIFNSFDNYNPHLKEIIKNLKGDKFLTGNWMNEQYFLHNKIIIQNELKIKNPPTKKNSDLISEISSTNSVALCVRRGDFLDPYLKAQLGISTLNYFLNGVDLIAKKVDSPVYYIFSNDPEWVKDNIKIDYPTVFITHNGIDKDYEDLRLISNCKHFIISNSTFHWWGAWLSSNINKIVIAPDPWYNTYMNKSIIPNNWIKLKCDRSDLFTKSSNKIFKNSATLELKKNHKIKLSSLKQFKDNYKKDTMMKIVIQSSKDGFLKFNHPNLDSIKMTNNDLIDSINIAFYKGSSERYLQLDPIFSLNDLTIYHDIECSIKISCLAIKLLD
ncbi:MAG: alpha-1,2-fucosyltransferase [Methanobrevibacter sp.]|jgi:hypothetical protein|nr:alpha-1,2-fucosyltransferase [Candidatus Methanovirga basalitermitum]